MNEKTHFVAGYCIARGFHCSLVYDRVENRWTKKLIKSTYFDDLKSAELVLTEIKVKWKHHWNGIRWTERVYCPNS